MRKCWNFTSKNEISQLKSWKFISSGENFGISHRKMMKVKQRNKKSFKYVQATQHNTTSLLY